MDAAQEKLNDRIRETIGNMRDEDLIHMVQSTSGEYTQFALAAARREIARRGGERALIIKLSEGPSTKTAGEPEFIRAPLEEPSIIGTSTGCYIEVWRDKDFEGESLRIEGPGGISDLCSNNLSWCGRIKSLRVGPRAFVLAYHDKGFKGKMIRLGPSEEVPDLANVKFDDEIDSIRIVDSIKVFDCTSSVRDRGLAPSEGRAEKDMADLQADEHQQHAGRHHKRKKH